MTAGGFVCRRLGYSGPDADRSTAPRAGSNGSSRHRSSVKHCVVSPLTCIIDPTIEERPCQNHPDTGLRLARVMEGRKKYRLCYGGQRRFISLGEGKSGMVMTRSIAGQL